MDLSIVIDVMVDNNIDVTKYWTLLIRKDSASERVHEFTVRDFNFLDTRTSFAHSLEDYTVAFVGYTGESCSLYYQQRGNKKEKIETTQDLGFGDGVPRKRVSDLVGQTNINAASQEQFTIIVEGDNRTSIELRLEDTRPFEITDAIRDQNIDIDLNKLEKSQTSRID